MTDEEIQGKKPLPRHTHQKDLIFAAMTGKGVHRTAEEVLEIVQHQDPNVGRATVYRNLKRLVEEGKIQKIDGVGWSYFDGNPVPHDHMHCRICGKVVDYHGEYSKIMDRTAEKKVSGKILFHMTTYEGICDDCLHHLQKANSESLRRAMKI